MYPLLAAAIFAQQFLPATPVVRGGLADLREPRTAIGFITTDLFDHELRARPGQGLPVDEDAARDVQGVVELGTHLPLIAFGKITASLQGGAQSRFRLERSDNDALTVDYMIAFPLSYDGQRWQGRVRLIHRSAHLGDEIVQNDGFRRLEFDHEEIDALLARKVGRFRVYGYGTFTLASSFGNDDHGLGLGAEVTKAIGTKTAVVGGVDWQRHTIAEGRGRVSGVLGMETRGAAGRLRLDGLFSTGASPLGEFFLQSERFWGLRLVLDQFNWR